MDDGGWTIGVLTWISILGGAAAYAYAAVRHIEREVPKPAPKGDRTDMRAILDAQAKQAEQRARMTYSAEGTTLADWADRFARRLVEVWMIDYNEALRLTYEWLDLCDMRFPDPAYDWSLRSAVEMADEYMRENGEEYGANA